MKDSKPREVEGIPLGNDPGFGAVFLCPVCGDEYCQMYKISDDDTGDVRISMMCEHGRHHWILRLMNHKGQLQGKVFLQ